MRLATDDKKYRTCFNIDGGAGSYYLTFTFSKSFVNWDEYCGEALLSSTKKELTDFKYQLALFI